MKNSDTTMNNAEKMKKQWKTMKNTGKTKGEKWKNNEKIWKKCKTMKTTMNKQWKVMKKGEKQMKHNQKQ